MKLNCVILLLAIQLAPFPIFAQTISSYEIVFHPEFNHSPFRLDGTFYKLNSGDSIRFEAFKFYISGIEFLLNEKSVWKEDAGFHLINADDEKSEQVTLHIPAAIAYDQVKFNLGIDSVTNVSGAMGGDLDPTKGMYWTWQNGYINLKLEGSSNRCNTRSNEFQFHIGGYQFPNNAIQQISVLTVTEKTMDININLEKVAENWDFARSSHVMSPSKEAVQFSRMIASVFVIREK